MSTTITDPANAGTTNPEVEADPSTDHYAVGEQAIREARQAVVEALRDLAAAEALPASLRRRLSAGDSAVTAEALAGASYAEERCKLLRNAAKQRLSRLLSTTAHRPTVAILLASAVGQALDVEDVRIVDGKDDRLTPLGVTLRQTGQTITNDTGSTLRIEGGEAGVEAVLWRSRRYAPADWPAVEAAIRRAGHNVKVLGRGQTQSGESLIADKALIVVTAANTGIVAADQDPSWEEVRMLRDAVEGEVRLPQHLRLSSGSWSAERSVSRGKVRTVVTMQELVNLTVHPVTGRPSTSEEAEQSLDGAPGKVIGRSFAGIGTVVSTRNLPWPERNGRTALAIRWELTCEADASTRG